ncbi:MAG: hypothetical protein L3J16_02360, partial [Anaerolineales bacterium]|nr:hypothetical protein [Anaerolineales bacterium]
MGFPHTPEPTTQPKMSSSQLIVDILPGLVYLTDSTGAILEHKMDDGFFRFSEPSSKEKLQDVFPQVIKNQALQAFEKVSQTQKTIHLTYSINAH